MAASMAGNGKTGPEMNVTPLIDVLLVLLVIFMIILPNEPRKGLETQIPQSSTKQEREDPDRAVIVQVTSRGADEPGLNINRETVTWKNLQGRLREIFAMRVERVAFVQADGDLDFEVIAQVIDDAHAAGIDHIGLMPAGQVH